MSSLNPLANVALPEVHTSSVHKAAPLPGRLLAALRSFYSGINLPSFSRMSKLDLPSLAGKHYDAAQAMPLAASAATPSATAARPLEEASWKGSMSSSGSTAREDLSVRRSSASGAGSAGRRALEAVPETEPHLAAEPSPGRPNSGAVASAAAAGGDAPGGALRAVSLGRAPSATTLTRTGSSYRSVFIQSMDTSTAMTPFVRAASIGPGQGDAAAGGQAQPASAAAPGGAAPVVSPFIAMARVSPPMAEQVVRHAFGPVGRLQGLGSLCLLYQAALASMHR